MEIAKQQAAFKAYLKDCDENEIVPNTTGAFVFAWQAAIEAAKPRIIAEFLKRTGQWLTNEATHKKAISDAIEADRQVRGEPVHFARCKSYSEICWQIMSEARIHRLKLMTKDLDGWEFMTLYRMPHPPVAPINDKPVCGEQNAIHAPQPQQTPEGYKLVPIELLNFIAAKEHHLPVEDRHCLWVMLEAAPEPKGKS